MILDPAKAIPVVSNIISGAHFNDATMGQAFDALVSLHNAGRPVGDFTLVVRELSAMGVTTGSQLVKFASELPNIAHAGFYADRVRDLARLRGMLVAAESFRSRLFDRDATPDDVLAWLEGKMLTLRHGAARDARPVAEVWEDVLNDLQSRVGKPDPIALLSGLPSADALGLVFSPGEITILAARTNVGKTSFATQIAMHHAARGRAVLFASLEMRDKELGSRILYASDGANHQTIRTGRIDQLCVDQLRGTKDILGTPPLYIWSPGRVKVGAIQAAASVHKAARDIKLLVVDYIGWVLPDNPRAERHEQVGDIVKGLREIGQRLDIPVLALCQLNREAERERPKLSNLRESGKIEEDADIVAFLHPLDPQDESRVELIVAKNRQGSKGAVELRWQKEQTKFHDLSMGRPWTPDTSGHRGSEPASEQF